MTIAKSSTYHCILVKANVTSRYCGYVCKRECPFGRKKVGERMTIPKKTIADTVLDVLKETDNPAIMFGDVVLLDMVAVRCAHTTLMKLHPMVRHKRILDALEGDNRFEKRHVRMNGYHGNQLWRNFKVVLKDAIVS